MFSKISAFIANHSGLLKLAGAVDLAACAFFAPNAVKVGIIAGAVALILGGAFKKA